eukprot:scaffold7358_cov66-Phaeocystis_antarctica.AAC.1
MLTANVATEVVARVVGVFARADTRVVVGVSCRLVADQLFDRAVDERHGSCLHAQVEIGAKHAHASIAIICAASAVKVARFARFAAVADKLKGSSVEEHVDLVGDEPAVARLHVGPHGNLERVAVLLELQACALAEIDVVERGK